jgi:hypothetical protein
MAPTGLPRKQERVIQPWGLREVAERLLIPRDAAAFWGLVAVLIALISGMSNQGGETNVNVMEQTTISVSPQSAPTPHMSDAAAKSAIEPRRPPLPPRKKRETGRKEAEEEALAPADGPKCLKTIADGPKRRLHGDKSARRHPWLPKFAGGLFQQLTSDDQ